MPVTKQAAWFWALGEVALDWVDIPHSMGIFCTSSGKAIPTPETEQYRVVIFDAMGNSTGTGPQKYFNTCACQANDRLASSNGVLRWSTVPDPVG